MDRVEDYVKDSMEGLFAVTEALLFALCEDGHLPRDGFRRTLEITLAQLPEDQAFGDKGAVFEHMIDILAAEKTENRQKVTALYSSLKSA